MNKDQMKMNSEINNSVLKIVRLSFSIVKSIQQLTSLQIEPHLTAAEGQLFCSQTAD